MAQIGHLFHTLAEGFSISVVGATFALSQKTWDFTDYGYLQLLGMAFFFIGGLDMGPGSHRVEGSP